MYLIYHTLHNTLIILTWMNDEYFLIILNTFTDSSDLVAIVMGRDQ